MMSGFARHCSRSCAVWRNFTPRRHHETWPRLFSNCSSWNMLNINNRREIPSLKRAWPVQQTSCVLTKLISNTNQCSKPCTGTTTSRQYSTDVSPLCHPLDKRTVIRLGGRDASTFLQGLITNDMQILDGYTEQGEQDRSNVLYSMMLNLQGRVLYDMLVYRLTVETDLPVYLLECDVSIATELVQTMKRYKIRKKVTIDQVGDEYKLFAILSPEGSTVSTPVTVETNVNVVTMVTDPRIPGFGQRLITRDNTNISELVPGSNVHTDDTEYTRCRYRLGLGEGVLDLPPANSTPLEANAVFLNAVSFTKGCYIGQELTARTHHTGVIRKRLMPVTLTGDTSEIEHGATVETPSGKSCGKLRNTVGSDGLALLRLADVIGQQLTCKHGEDEVTTLHTHIPTWWPRDSDEVIKQILTSSAAKLK